MAYVRKNEDGSETLVEEHDGRVISEIPFVAVASPPQRWITPGALFDRLGDQKHDILKSDDPDIRALVTDVTPRRYIDLDRPDLGFGLQMLVAKGFPIDPEAVITAPIRDIERP